MTIDYVAMGKAEQVQYNIDAQATWLAENVDHLASEGTIVIYYFTDKFAMYDAGITTTHMMGRGSRM